MGTNFKRIASGLDVQSLSTALEAQPHLWGEITDRQTVPGSPHSETQTIFVRWCEAKTVEACFNDIPAIDYPAIESLPEVRPLIAQLVGLVGATELGRVIIVKFKSGGYIDPHVDEGAYAAHHDRFHIPVQTAEGNVFFSGSDEHHGEFCHMRVGEAWWFDNKKRHWLMNASDIDRIHLIIDAVTPKPSEPM